MWSSLQLVEAFTQNKAKVEARKGGLYSILGGKISGEFVELVGSGMSAKAVESVQNKLWFHKLCCSFAEETI